MQNKTPVEQPTSSGRAQDMGNKKMLSQITTLNFKSQGGERPHLVCAMLPEQKKKCQACFNVNKYVDATSGRMGFHDFFVRVNPCTLCDLPYCIRSVVLNCFSWTYLMNLRHYTRKLPAIMRWLYLSAVWFKARLFFAGTQYYWRMLWRKTTRWLALYLLNCCFWHMLHDSWCCQQARSFVCSCITVF